MRLTELTDGVVKRLEERLCAGLAAPVVVAFSGGGDSLALLIAAARWATGAGRPLLAVTVDHRLQPAGALWARWCATRAAALGVDHRTLAWTGEKPPRGLAAAAREARHRLIAEAARAAGARVILMGHTADDIFEAQQMRRMGERMGTPRAWSPSPIWPEGRDLFILRPLLGFRRAAIRSALAAAGETWVEDPANADPAQPRARARLALAGCVSAPPPVQVDRPCLAAVSAGPVAGFVVGRADLLALTPAATRRILGVAIVCASGAARPARGASLDRLIARLGGGEDFVATLAGARIEADGAAVRFWRDSGDLARRSATPTALPVGAPAVWDGRFEITAWAAGLTVRPLAGLAKRLPALQRQRLARTPRAARGGLPALVDAAGEVACPAVADDPRVRLRPLGEARLAAALGAIGDEAAIWRVAKRAGTS